MILRWLTVGGVVAALVIAMAIAARYAPPARAVCIAVMPGEASSWNKRTKGDCEEFPMGGVIGKFTKVAFNSPPTSLNGGREMCIRVENGIEFSGWRFNTCAGTMEAMNGFVKAKPVFLARPRRGKIVGNGGRQIFSGAVATTCGSVKYTGTVKAGEDEEEETTDEEGQLLQAQYTKCETVGSASTVSTAEYNLTAEGSLSLVNNIVITSNVAKCSIKIAAASNKTLWTVKYTNTVKGIVEESQLRGIAYAGSGGLCGESGTNGTYEGLANLENETGTLKWG